MRLTILRKLLISIIAVVVSAAVALPAQAVTDYFGREFAPGEYQRIVSLAPSLTETLDFLGAFDRIVGVTDFDSYPPEVAQLPRVGGYIDPDLERIVSLQPDLVLAFRGNPLPVIHKLRALGLTVFVLDNPESLAGVYEQALKLAELLDVGKDARKRVAELKAEFDAAASKAENLQRRPRVLMLACSLQPPFYAAGQGTFVNDLIKHAGGANAFTGKGFGVITPETILTVNPEVILLPELLQEGFREKAVAALRRQPYFAATDALKRNRVVFINEDILSRPGPRLAEALRILQQAIGDYMGEDAGR